MAATPHRRPVNAATTIASDRHSRRTIYFEGFPSGWNESHLSRVFSKYGVFGSISLAFKKNVRSLRFGFIRPHHDLSPFFVISRINQIVIGTSRIKAYLARYPLQNNKQHQVPRKQQSSRPVPPPSFKPANRDTRSYAEVIGAPGSSSPDLIFKYEGIASKPERMNMACMVHTRNIEAIPSLESSLANRGFNLKFVAPLGSMAAINGLHSIDAMKGFMEEDWLTLKDIIEKVDQINPSFIPASSLQWIDFNGIPLSLINKDFVSFLAAKFGSLVNIDFDFTCPLRLDMVSCLISGSPKIQDCGFTVLVEERELHLQMSVRQVSFCSCSADLSNSAAPAQIVTNLIPVQSSVDMGIHTAQHFINNSPNPEVPTTDRVPIKEAGADVSVVAATPSSSDSSNLQTVSRKIRRRGKQILPDGIGQSISIGSSCDHSLDIANRNQLLLPPTPEEQTPEDEAT